MAKQPEKVKLQVAEALSQDVGFGRARLDQEILNKLKLKPGDVITITGEETTCAVVWRSHPDDAGLESIRIDKLTRRNAQLAVGDTATIQKIDAPDINQLTITPQLSKEQQVQFSDGIDTLIRRGLVKRPICQGDTIIIPNIALFGTPLPFLVTKQDPRQPGIVTETTQIIIDEAAQLDETLEDNISYEDIGGLKQQLEAVREMIELPLKHPELFDTLGIDPPKGVLLHGPPGTGKTLIARAVANECGANFYTVNGPELLNKYYGSSEANLRNVFETASKNAPSIIFFDELDSISSKREETQGEVERRMVSQMLTLMDGLKHRGKVMVIGATNRVDSIDEALRRPGRFDRELEIGAPDAEARREIFEIHTRNMPTEKDGRKDNVDVDKIVHYTHGFVGADMAALCREAAMKTLRRHLPEIDLEKPIPVDILAKMRITMNDFKQALKTISPSALREFFVEIPNTTWNSVGGLNEIKQQLKEAVEWPLEYPERFERLGIDPPRGILLYGPPGTGKTLLAKAVANETGANFLSVKGPEIMNKWVGESEKAIRTVFSKAKQAAPSIIFFDELDALAPMRGNNSNNNAVENVVNQILTCMDGLEELDDVVIIGATNRPDIIDPALLRAGRFDRLIKVSVPDIEARKSILEIHTENMPLEKDVNLNELAKLTKGYVGADIKSVCREAAIIALRENPDTKKVNKHYFEEALRTVRSSVTPELVKYYDRLAEQLSQNNLRRINKGDSGMEFL